MNGLIHSTLAKWCFIVGLFIAVADGVALAVAVIHHDGSSITIFRIVCLSIGGAALWSIGGAVEAQHRQRSRRS